MVVVKMLGRFFAAGQYENYLTRLIGTIGPTVSRCVLHHDITGFHGHFFALIKQHHAFSG